MSKVLMKCTKCNFEFPFGLQIIGGGSIKVGGSLKTNCPQCGNPVEAPGGEFKATKEGLERKSPNNK